MHCNTLKCCQVENEGQRRGDGVGVQVADDQSVPPSEWVTAGRTHRHLGYEDRGTSTRPVCVYLCSGLEARIRTNAQKSVQITFYSDTCIQLQLVNMK